MKYIEVINITESQKWNAIIETFKNYDVFYLSSYAKAFQLHGEGIPLLFYFDNSRTRAINVVMKRDISENVHFKEKIPKNTYFDFSTPYGYGGFLIEGEDVKVVQKAYRQYCRDNNIICEFVRFNLFSNYHKSFDGHVESKTHNVVRNLNLELSEMLMDFEHKVRKNLKKANKNDLSISICEDDEGLDEFLSIYYSTMDRNAATEVFYFKKDFFEELIQMKNNVAFFYVIHFGTIIASELVLYDKTNCYSFLGGTLSEYFDLRPNEFLKFEIIKWAINKKLENFILGGGYGTDDGIYKYKKSFAPKGIFDFYVGHQIFNQKKFDELVRIREGEKDFDFGNEYFPKYRG